MLVKGSDVATIVACGGAGRRLGWDKPSRVLAGKALIERAIEQAAAFGGPAALAVAGTGRFSEHGLPQLPDDPPDIGPIAALRSGFRFAHDVNCSHLLMIGCDQPFLPDDLVERLRTAIGTHGAAVPVSHGRDQYMAALWRVNLLALEGYIASGERSLWRFAETVGMTRLEWEDSQADPFADIDDAEALASAEARIGGEGR